MRKPCCLNCAYFYAYSHQCYINFTTLKPDIIDDPEKTKCDSWKYDEVTAFDSGYQDKEEHDNWWHAKCCPVCHSDNIRLKEENVVGDSFYPAQVECLNCGFTSHESNNINNAIRWWNDEQFRKTASQIKSSLSGSVARKGPPNSNPTKGHPER